MPRTLHFFTSHFPLVAAPDRPFIEPELKELREHFKKIIFYPFYDATPTVDLPSGVSVNGSISRIRIRRALNPFHWLKLAKCRDFREEWASPASEARRVILSGFLKVAVARWSAVRASTFGRSDVFYTSTIGPVTLGLCRGLTAHRSQLVVSRCTGGDTREDQHDSNHIPYKKATLQSVDHLFPVSKCLANIICAQYPSLVNRVTMACNGVPEPGFVVSRSNDGVRQIMSCGRMDALKRYDLLASAMVKMAKCQPSIHFCWKHMLLGKMDRKIGKFLAKNAPPNLEHIFITGIRDVVSFYKSLKIDLFVHVSRSEGFGVAIAEALSCGIPVLATDSGGVTEMVDDSVGRLADNYLTTSELADELWALLENPDKLALKKPQAINRWRNVAHAETVYSKFAQTLVKMRRK